LMAPGIAYQDHSHPPEEVYLALSRGFWRHEAGAWHEPGLGGIFYNPRGITHAMRSSCEPFLAIWCLPIDEAIEFKFRNQQHDWYSPQNRGLQRKPTLACPATTMMTARFRMSA
jgi:Dimethlysulfonioproprionate lyase